MYCIVTNSLSMVLTCVSAHRNKMITVFGALYRIPRKLSTTTECRQTLKQQLQGVTVKDIQYISFESGVVDHIHIWSVITFNLQTLTAGYVCRGLRLEALHICLLYSLCRWSWVRLWRYVTAIDCPCSARFKGDLCLIVPSVVCSS
jgi:hypothetical protein